MRTRATEPKLSRLGELSNKVDAIVRRCLEGYDRLEGVVGDAEDANGKVANQGQSKSIAEQSLATKRQRRQAEGALPRSVRERMGRFSVAR